MPHRKYSTKSIFLLTGRRGRRPLQTDFNITASREASPNPKFEIVCVKPTGRRVVVPYKGFFSLVPLRGFCSAICRFDRPLTENAHILSICAAFPAGKRVQTGEIWAFNGKRCCKSLVPDKTNLPRSDASSLTARESAQKSAYLCFSALASCTVVPRRAEKQALMQFRLWHAFSLL